MLLYTLVSCIFFTVKDESQRLGTRLSQSRLKVKKGKNIILSQVPRDKITFLVNCILLVLSFSSFFSISYFIIDLFWHGPNCFVYTEANLLILASFAFREIPFFIYGHGRSCSACVCTQDALPDL